MKTYSFELNFKLCFGLRRVCGGSWGVQGGDDCEGVGSADRRTREQS
jgi:hypothetical protein